MIILLSFRDNLVQSSGNLSFYCVLGTEEGIVDLRQVTQQCSLLLESDGWMTASNDYLYLLLFRCIPGMYSLDGS